MSNPDDTRLEPGDVFVKQWGDKEMAIVMLPRHSRSAKQPYRRLHLPGLSIETAWWTTRANVMVTWKRDHTKGWHYIGRIPDDDFINELATQAFIRKEI